MSEEAERWAEAVAVLNQHGNSAPLFIAQRIGELALLGDEDGVARWRSIAIRLDRLIGRDVDGAKPN